MLIRTKNFKNPATGKFHHGFNSVEESWADPWRRAKYKFNMNNLDFIDPLIYEDGGYVRYHGASLEVLEYLKEEFGFEEE